MTEPLLMLTAQEAADVTELGNRGASEVEIIAFTGHEPGSSVIRNYVKPERAAALRGARKRRE